MAVIFRRRGAAPRLGKLASDYAVGESVFLPVNNVNTEFLVVHQGNPDSAIYSATCDGTWLLMKDIYENRAWNSDGVNDYENSNLNAYLNGDFCALLSAAAQAAIKQVKIPYRPGSGSSGDVSNLENGLSTKAFLLSGEEVGLGAQSYMPRDEGRMLDYFLDGTGSSANARRIATINGSAAIWWLRSPRCYFGAMAHDITATGATSRTSVSTSEGMRPAIIINSDTKFDPETNIIKG